MMSQAQAESYARDLRELTQTDPDLTARIDRQYQRALELSHESAGADMQTSFAQANVTEGDPLVVYMQKQLAGVDMNEQVDAIRTFLDGERLRSERDQLNTQIENAEQK